MAARASRLWRQVRLGAGFVEFAVAALGVAFVVAPLARRRARDGEAAELAVQGAIRKAYAASVGFWQALGLIRFDAGDLDGLAEIGPCVVVANHPTLIDVVLIGSCLEQMDCIVNAGWTAKSPFLAKAIDAAGFVRNDAGSAIVSESADRLKRGRRLLVFPEGTRSPRGRLGRFHRGAAHIALASDLPIVAVTIGCRPHMLGRDRPWHEVVDQTSEFKMRIAGRLNPSDYRTEGGSTPIAARRMTEDLLVIFHQEPNLADA